MRKILIKSAATVASLALLLLVLVAVIDLGMFRDKAEALVSEGLGRDFVVDGALHVHLFPTPTVRAEGIRIANAEWAVADDFIEVEKLDLTFDLWSAIRPPFRVVDLAIDGVSLNVELQGGGLGNWPLGNPSAESSEPATDDTSNMLLLGKTSISNLEISYRDPSMSDEPVKIMGELLLTQNAVDALTGAVDVTIAGPAVSQQLVMLGSNALDLKSEFALSVSGDAANLRFDELAIRSGDSDVAGEIELSVGELTAVSGTLWSDALVFVESEIEEESDLATDEPFFADDSGLFDAVRDFPAEIDVEIRVNEIRQSALVRASALSSSVNIRSGELRVSSIQVEVNGGSIVGEALVSAANDNGAMTLELKAEGVRMAQSMDAESGENTEPPVDLSLSVAGIGNTPHAVATSMNGSLAVDIASGRSRQGDVGFLANDVLAEMFSAVGDKEDFAYTDVECGIVRATIENGQTDFSALLIKTTDLVVTGSGGIDLESESIDIGFNTKARDGLGIAAAGLVTPFVKLGGSLRRPAVTVDAPSALLAGGLAVATGGVSLLGKEVLDRVVSEAADCSPANSR